MCVYKLYRHRKPGRSFPLLSGCLQNSHHFFLSLPPFFFCFIVLEVQEREKGERGVISWFGCLVDYFVIFHLCLGIFSRLVKQLVNHHHHYHYYHIVDIYLFPLPEFALAIGHPAHETIFHWKITKDPGQVFGFSVMGLFQISIFIFFTHFLVWFFVR